MKKMILFTLLIVSAGQLFAAKGPSRGQLEARIASINNQIESLVEDMRKNKPEGPSVHEHHEMIQGLEDERLHAIGQLFELDNPGAFDE